MVVSELRGEKIDIIPYNEEPARFVAKALSPARVREVLVDDEERQATVIVPDDQLSLAIGREGQNARLAAKLTGWRVDIVGESEFAEQADDDEGFEGEEEAADGRCAAVLSRRPPLPERLARGSRYCGLPQHQALARFATNQVTVLCARSARTRSQVLAKRRLGRRRGRGDRRPRRGGVRRGRRGEPRPRRPTPRSAEAATRPPRRTPPDAGVRAEERARGRGRRQAEEEDAEAAEAERAADDRGGSRETSSSTRSRKRSCRDAEPVVPEDAAVEPLVDDGATGEPVDTEARRRAAARPKSPPTRPS